jgi:hypothetical protein
MSTSARISRMIGVCLAGLGVLWALGVVLVVWHSANKMIGFHPLILSAMPVWGTAAVAGLVLGFTRLRAIAFGLLFGAAVVGIVIFNLRGVSRFAYAWHVREYANENTAALVKLRNNNAITLETFMASQWDAPKLQAVIGAKWYEMNDYVAPSGVLWGANVAGVPHVRLEKVRHGWLGLAYAQSLDELHKAGVTDGIKYSSTSVSNLWLWNTGQ